MPQYEIGVRAYALDRGRIAHDGRPESIRGSNILTDVFLGCVRREGDAGEGDS